MHNNKLSKFSHLNSKRVPPLKLKQKIRNFHNRKSIFFAIKVIFRCISSWCTTINYYNSGIQVLKGSHPLSQNRKNASFTTGSGFFFSKKSYSVLSLEAWQLWFETFFAIVALNGSYPLALGWFLEKKLSPKIVFPSFKTQNVKVKFVNMKCWHN